MQTPKKKISIYLPIELDLLIEKLKKGRYQLMSGIFHQALREKYKKEIAVIVKDILKSKKYPKTTKNKVRQNYNLAGDKNVR